MAAKIEAIAPHVVKQNQVIALFPGAWGKEAIAIRVLI
jgi:hypothetical protein